MKLNQARHFHFISGNGIFRGNEVYLGTPQIDPKNPLIEGFALLDLTKLMSSSRSKQIVGIIDACHSGAASIKFKPKAAKEETNRALAVYDRIGKQIPKTKGISLLLSSQDYQSSFAAANTNNDNSFYTKYILEAIGGVKPGVDENGRYIRYSGSVDEFGDVTPHSIHEYVYYRVASKIEEQIPRFTSSTSGNIVILHYPELGLHTFEDQERVIPKQVILAYSELVQSMISVIHIKGELKEIVDEGIPEGIEKRRRKIRRARYDAKRASPLLLSLL